MSAPKCRICSHEHWSTEPHVFPDTPSRATKAPVAKPDEVKAPRANRPVSQLASAEQLASSTYRHRDPEKRRAYQRDLMRSRRLAARRAAG